MRFFFPSPSPSAIECFLVSRKRKIKKTISRPKEEGGERRAQAKREQRNRSRLRGKNTKREFPAGDVRNKSGGEAKKEARSKEEIKKALAQNETSEKTRNASGTAARQNLKKTGNKSCASSPPPLSTSPAKGKRG